MIFSNKTTTTNKYFSESTCPKAKKLIFSQEFYVDLTVKTGWNRLKKSFLVFDFLGVFHLQI